MERYPEDISPTLSLHWFTVCGSPWTNPHYREPQDGDYVLAYVGTPAQPVVARYDARQDLFLSSETGKALSGVHSYLLLPSPEEVYVEEVIPPHSHAIFPA